MAHSGVMVRSVLDTRPVLGLLALGLAALGLTALAPTARGEVDVAEQRSRIDSALSAFASSEVDAPDAARVFFLGFAGFGEERVFAEEIKLAARQVGERFGSSARTLLLINDRRDLASFPLATHDNLRYALRRLAALMDADRDILFLAVSSHGSQNGMVAVSNTGLPQDIGLSPDTLAKFLREAGIRWKVVVVSACYSGQFVGPLADDHSIVISAAAGDRTSFGCSDDRHLTYFGEAFFRDALPEAPTLRAAFERTREDIRRRERAERVTPSRPQAHFGELAETRLEALEAQALCRRMDGGVTTRALACP